MNTTTATSGHAILVVDDSAATRRQVRMTLAGHDVIEAADGLAACAVLRDHADIAVIICDLAMPRMGGLELVEALHAWRRAVPVVMLTTEADPEVASRGQRLGVRAWLSKPFEPHALRELVERLINEPSAHRT